jgi:hypothetical protein
VERRPGHRHSGLDAGDQLGAAIDALHIDGVEESVARVPAELEDPLAEPSGLGGEAATVVCAVEARGQFGGCLQVLIEEAIEQEVRGGEEGPSEGSGVVVVADGDIISPDEQPRSGLIIVAP